MITLKSNRLRVRIAEPGEAPNQTHRFDRAGFISEIQLDDRISFCASEPENLSHPCTGGHGLCCEFKTDAGGECAVGEYFPKLGVGLIRKEDDCDYVFHRRYRDVIPFSTAFSANESAATFTTQPLPCRGYAVRTVRRIEVEENRLTLHAELTNTGDRTVIAAEYCHNFISIGGLPLSSAYCWESPQLNSPPTDPALPVQATEHGFRFAETNRTAFAFRLDFLRPPELDWRLSNAIAGASVCAHESFMPDGIQIWSSGHMICPEVFHNMQVAPGETHGWSRTYRFEQEKVITTR